MGQNYSMEQVLPWLLLIPIVMFLGLFAFSGSTIMAPIGWIGLYLLAKKIYIGIRYPETLLDDDEPESAAGPYGKKSRTANFDDRSDTEEVDDEDLQVERGQSKRSARRARASESGSSSGPRFEEDAFEVDNRFDKFD
jgi:hypothetical protein